MNKISVCFSSDNNYVQHLGAAISSILKNKNAEEYINIYIIDGGITDENKEKLEFFEKNYECKITYVKPDLEKLKNCNTFQGDYISLATYYRLLIPEIIPNEDKIIYLDCDIIVRKSLSELYNQEFNDNLIIGVEDLSGDDAYERLHINQYINGGVLLMNCKKMREEHSVDKIFQWISDNKDKIECHDQDVVNTALKGRIGLTDLIYNTQVFRNHHGKFDEIENPVILHFISPRKPWTLWKPLNSTHWGKEYFDAIVDTPWEYFINEYKIKYNLIFPFLILYPTGLSRDLLRWIFSVRNTSDHKNKIITILGFKIIKERHKIVKNQKSIKILVTYHKKSNLYKNNILTPIQCGRDSKLKNQNPKDYCWLLTHMIGDNTGDNISYKNSYLNETTAIYWAWKNYDAIGNPDYIGLNHYRRFFKTIYTKHNLIKKLEKYDFIEANKPKYKEGLRKQWENCIKSKVVESEDLEKFLEIYKEIYPNDYKNFNNYLDNDEHGGLMNLFIMKKGDFFAYCEWIFPILTESEKKISTKTRAIGMFGERLTSYYLYLLRVKGEKGLALNIDNIPCTYSLSYISKKIISIQIQKRQDNTKHLKIIIFGLIIKIKMGKFFK